MPEELLFEIGTEELPPGFIAPALKGMKETLNKELGSSRIGHQEIITLGTPRRLVLAVQGLDKKQGDLIIESTGPKKSIAFDKEGNPTRAAIGFAKGQGVTVEQLEIFQTGRGDCIGVKKEVPGKETREILPHILLKLIGSVPFKKSMRWGDSDIRFARPIHWILAIYDGEIVPLELGEIKSRNISRGHRFLSPRTFIVNNYTDYLIKMRESYVIVDPAERKKIILDEALKITSTISGKIMEDEGLLDLLTNLTEYPTVICGSFDKEFLNLPPEVLIACMREHQKYFSVIDGNGKLLPNFVAVNNTLPKNSEIVVKGNERVLRARLSDAKFFFEEDRKVLFDKLTDKLKGVLFQERLGSYYAKAERLCKIIHYLAGELHPDKKAKAERAAFLCKVDLVTGMVGEFPGLQGKMGEEYALLSGEDEEVSKAIREHYLPAFAGDILPSSPIGAILSISDKIDTIVGCFGVNLLPTGTADPYALRRQALGIINIILEKNYPLSLHALLDIVLPLLEDKLTRGSSEVKQDVLEFFRLRYKNLAISRGSSSETVEAVSSVGFDQLTELNEKIKALDEFKSHPHFESLVTAFKRASRIVEKSAPIVVDAALFENSAEAILFDNYRNINNLVNKLSRERLYRDALMEIAKLKDPIDNFFEGVMVMAKDDKIRENRLALLGEIVKLFTKIADFTKIGIS